MNAWLPPLLFAAAGAIYRDFLENFSAVLKTAMGVTADYADYAEQEWFGLPCLLERLAAQRRSVNTGHSEERRAESARQRVGEGGRNL